MRRVRKSECAVLHLVLKHKWFDMIERGEKKEEYRDAGPYWSPRILRWLANTPDKQLVVAFARGRTRASMFFHAGVMYGWPVLDRLGAHPEWGEQNGEAHWVIVLGERVEVVEGEA